jgi:endonuclease/exonuclease/phosphatase family metal-dependent hydrolase
VTFASFHINGYNFDELQNALRNQTPANLERNIRRGDEFCQRILEAVNQVGAGTLQIMGADMNSNPGNERSIQQKFHQRPLPGRFSVLEGFHRITPLDPTNYNNRDRIADKERTLDFIFVRDKQETMNCWQRFWQWLVSLFRSSYRLESTTLEQAQMTLRDVLDDPTRHFSDHLPVEAHVRIQQIAPRLCG